MLLSDQDRRRWHHGEIGEGLELARRAHRYGRPGAYVLQALIAAEHASEASTDWNLVAALYEQLEEIRPSPVVRLNRAVAVAEAEGAAAALPLLDALDGKFPDSHQLAATRAELLLRLDQAEPAVAAYDRALARQTNDDVRRHLSDRRSEAARRSGPPRR